MKKTIALSFAALTVACVSKYKTDSFSAPGERVRGSESAYVMLAHDGTYGSRSYAGSGQTVSKYLYASVLSHMPRVEAAAESEKREQALAYAREKDLTYVFEPTILHWEDRATEWSGKLDRISVHFSVWNVATGELVASSTERASSKWFTFGGDHPQDLVPRMVDKFTSRLFE